MFFIQNIFFLHNYIESIFLNHVRKKFREVRLSYDLHKLYAPFCLQRKIFSEPGSSKPDLDCNYTFPIYLVPNRITFGAESNLF